MSEEMKGEAVSLIDYGCLLLLIYHFKEVYIYNYSGRLAQRHLLLRENGLLAAWQYQFYGI